MVKHLAHNEGAVGSIPAQSIFLANMFIIRNSVRDLYLLVILIIIISGIIFVNLSFVYSHCDSVDIVVDAAENTKCLDSDKSFFFMIGVSSICTLICYMYPVLGTCIIIGAGCYIPNKCVNIVRPVVSEILPDSQVVDNDYIVGDLITNSDSVYFESGFDVIGLMVFISTILFIYVNINISAYNSKSVFTNPSDYLDGAKGSEVDD